MKCYNTPLVTLNISGLNLLTTLNLVSGTNSISALTLTVPSTANIQHIIADSSTLLSTWTGFVCNNNNTIQSISLKNRVGLLSVTANNNTSLLSLDVTGSGMNSLTVHTSGNKIGFSTIGLQF